MIGPRSTGPRPIALWLLVAVLVAPLTVWASASAQPEARPGEARFFEVAATPSFPATIDFGLTVESPEAIVRAELLFAPRWVETVNLIEAQIEPGTRVDLQFPLDMYQNYFPPGLDLLYRWRVTDAAGRVTESEEQVVLWEDTRFDWQELSTDQVSVFYYTGNQAFNQRILESAQQTIDELQGGLGVERSRPIRLWIYDAREDFAGAQAPNSESWFVGASFSSLYLILSVIPDGNDYELDRLVPHEVSHQLLYQAAQNPFNPPARWLDEGIAVYNQDSDKEGFAPVLQAAVDEGRLIPLTGLHRQFPFDGTHHLAYAQSLSVVEFILAEWGEAALGVVIDAYGDGISHDDALQRGLGVTLAELEVRWHEQLGYQGTHAGDDGTGGPTGAIETSSNGSTTTGMVAVWLTGALVVAGVAVQTRRSGRWMSTPPREPAVGAARRTAMSVVKDDTRRSRILDPAAIERKLALNTYHVDRSRAHIRIIDHDVCLQCERQQCINCCPANCYVPRDDGRVTFSYEGCVECGTCRIVCHVFENIEWTYPRGGFGIQYQHG